MATTSAADAARRLWGWVLVRGILALLLGFAALRWPMKALFAFTLVFAVYCFIDGVASLISGIRGAREGQRWGALVLRGVTGVLVGLIFIAMPSLSTITYAFLTVVMLATWSILAGLLEIAAAVRLRKEIEGEWLHGLSGFISVLLGVAILFLIVPRPAATIMSAVWLIAIYAFTAGIVLIFEAFRLRRLAR